MYVEDVARRLPAQAHARSSVRRLQPPGLGDRSDSDRAAVTRAGRSRSGRRSARRRSRSAAWRACCSRSSGCWRSWARPSGRLRPAVRSAARRAGLRRPRAPLDSGSATSWRWSGSLRQMLDRSGSIEGFFLEGYDPAADDVGGGARQLFGARAGARPDSGVRTRRHAQRGRGVAYFFPRPSSGQRLQAAEPVSALDGAPRRARSRRLDARVAGEADRAARHPRHSRRPLPAADALHEPGLGDGARHHRVAAADRSGRSGQVRLLALPPRHDERLRLQPRAG